MGEAALSPAAYSLIADSFPAQRRATAISVYSMGIYLGSGLAFLLGGLVIKFASAQGDVHLPLLGEVRPWQLIFLILGAAGVLFTLLMLAVKEPQRHGVGAGVEVPMREVGAYLRANRKTVICHNFGFACISFASYGGGAAQLVTYNGDIRLTASRAASGRIEARTYNGDIHLRGVADRSELDVTTKTRKAREALK